MPNSEESSRGVTEGVKVPIVADDGKTALTIRFWAAIALESEGHISQMGLLRSEGSDATKGLPFRVHVRGTGFQDTRKFIRFIEWCQNQILDNEFCDLFDPLI